jgi:excisionase family DNA binding protein
MLTIKDVAVKFNVSIATIYRMVRAGKMPSLRVGSRGKTIRFIEEDIEKWIKEGKNEVK